MLPMPLPASRGRLAVIFLCASALFGQTAPVAKPEPPAAVAAKKLQELREKPKEYVDALAQYIQLFPDTDTAEGAGYSFRYALPKDYTTEQSRPLAAVMIQAISSVPLAALQERLYGDLCSTLAAQKLWPELTDVATRLIPLLDEARYVEFERHRFERQVAAARDRNPNYTASPFRVADWAARFTPFRASVYAYQARGFLGQAKLAEADAAFRTAYEIKPANDSAWGLGNVLEQRSEEAQALPYFTFAFLTGKLKAPEIAHYKALFAKLHPGEDVERYLDAEYLKRYHNPIPEEKYQPTPARSNRTVLAEFFTGGACVPCVPFDYAFERVLEGYSPREVVVLVDHWHAPSDDPLGNHSVDSRVKFYGVKGAPCVFIQGQRLQTRDDNAREDEGATVAPRVFRQLQAAINSELEAPAGAALEARVTRSGDTVRAIVTPGQFLKAGDKVTLQIALVENRVSYSGENGLRMQPMVVRNLGRAGRSSYGFPVDTTKPAPVAYTFDVKQIIAENLRYYDEYPEERKAEIAAEGRASILYMLTFDWREHKNVIDPNNLSVAAFLQNDETREVLQSILVPVSR